MEFKVYLHFLLQVVIVGPPDCSDVCRVSDGDVDQLTEDDKTYAEETCLPLLKTWNKQYRVYITINCHY